MSFEKWLVTHKKQQNAFGDLARDFIDSKCSTIERSFEEYSPCQEALDTYREARKQYMISLANDLFDELVKITDREKQECTLWTNSLETINSLKDILADLDSYLFGGYQNDDDE